MNALLVVDYQVDFAHPSGALYVPGGEKLGPKIEALAELYPLVVLTQDWHVPADMSFARQGGPWPDHCVAGTWGAEISPLIPRTYQLSMATFRKRFNSAFMDTGLDGYLRMLDVRELNICGLAADFCVLETAVSARLLGYRVNVLMQGTGPVTVQGGLDAMHKLQAAGARLL